MTGDRLSSYVVKLVGKWLNFSGGTNIIKMKELALNILDIVQNSIRAEATEVVVRIADNEKTNQLVFEISDNGTGISEELLANVTDPFVTSRTTRRVGMGLSLLKQHSEMAGGKMAIFSRPGEGTRVKAEFKRDHPDLQPLGDLPGVMMLLLGANPQIDFIFEFKTDKGNYTFSSAEVKEVLDIQDFRDFYLMEQVRALISENIVDMGVGM